ncbi:MAG: Nramp family divalent metal transporter [Chloroflexota bacterium]
MVRYTIYTGEPITVGFMRLAPGKTFWGVLFSVVGFIERSMPGWALATATALAAFQLGRIPGAPEQGTVVFFGYVVFLLCAFLVSIGGRIERTLEIANWIMMVVVLGGLLILDIIFVPASVWGEAAAGFLSIGQIPSGVNLLLLGALVGYSAYGGFGNNAITNWYRDKGYGMGKKVGYIPTLIGGTSVNVSPHGNVAPPTPANIESFKGWWRLLQIDQWGVFWLGGMLGMLLPAVLYVTMLPRGQALPSWGIAVSPASGLQQIMGPSGFYLIVFFGFWILFSTAISNIDLVCRQVTDMLWFASDNVRNWAKRDIRRVYYTILGLIVIWGFGAMNVTLPLVLLAVSANVANFTMALSAILTIIVNRKFLPAEFRPAVWREAVLLGCVAFFGFFFTLFIMSQVFGFRL